MVSYFSFLIPQFIFPHTMHPGLRLAWKNSYKLSRSIFVVPSSSYSTSTIGMARISDAIKQDHRDIEDAYSRIITAKDSDEKTRWQNQFSWELARHSIGEELVVYPAMEEHLPNGKELAQKDRAEHQVVSVIVKSTLSHESDLRVARSRTSCMNSRPWTRPGATSCPSSNLSGRTSANISKRRKRATW